MREQDEGISRGQQVKGREATPIVRGRDSTYTREFDGVLYYTDGLSRYTLRSDHCVPISDEYKRGDQASSTSDSLSGPTQAAFGRVAYGQ